MKNKILGIGLGLILGLVALCFINKGTRPAWADNAGLAQTAASVNWNYAAMLCSGNSGQVANNPTCNNMGAVNWTSMVNWLEANVNWQDLPGVTGAPTSASTWIKANPV